MLFDKLRNLFFQALRFDGNDATVLVTRWNEEIDYIQSVFDNMTSKKSKPLICTNADRIRAMTDEELAGWIIKHDCHTFLYGYDPKDAVFDWLKQEIQE